MNLEGGHKIDAYRGRSTSTIRKYVIDGRPMNNN